MTPSDGSIFSRASRRVNFGRAKIGLLKKLAVEVEISQCANDCPASF